MMMIATERKWVSHVCYWLIYTLYFYLINSLSNSDLSIFSVLGLIPYFALIFYVVLFILQRYFTSKRYMQGILVLLLFYGISGFVVYAMTYCPSSGYLLYGRYFLTDIAFSWKHFLQSILVMHGHFSILAVLYYQHHRKLTAIAGKLDETRERLKAEQEKTVYEYTSLAAQVSPHMMANVFLGWEKQLGVCDPKVAIQVKEMYHLMLFYIQAHQVDGPTTILLNDEVEATQRYVRVQLGISLRTIYVEWDIRGNLYGMAVPSTTLLTLVENAIKHGVVHDIQTPVKVTVRTRKRQLNIDVTNRIANRKYGSSNHGRGLRNLRRRLEIIFGDACTMDVTYNTDCFRASLSIHV